MNLLTRVAQACRARWRAAALLRADRALAQAQRPGRLVAPLMEACEPRILYSADLSPALLAGWADATAAADDGWDRAPLDRAAAVQAATPGHEWVFIDLSLDQAQTLMDDWQAQAAAGRKLTVVGFSADEDGLARITQTLAGQQGVSAVHILSHGQAGALQLGSSRLDGASLLARAGEVAAWRDALTEQADVLLYGCDVAADADGRQLLTDLAALTGADVAASDDATGAVALGADWRLERRTGHIEAALAVSDLTQARWQATLSLQAHDSFGNSGNLNGTGGGTGWAGTWSSASSQIHGVGTGLQDPSGLLPVSDGSAELNISGALATASASRELAVPVGADGSTTWISFLVQPDLLGLANYIGLEFGSTSNTVGFAGYNSSSFIVGEAGALASSAVSGVAPVSGQPALLVLRLDHLAGNDTITLYVNPTPGLAAPEATYSASTSLDLGSFTRIAISGGNGLGGTNKAQLDEIRVGSRYTDVAPIAPQAPVISSLGGGAEAAVTVAENSSAVTTVTATDVNLGDSLAYSIVGGADAARFVIDSASGVLQFAAGPDFEAPADANADNVYELIVQASDGSLNDQQKISVTVTDLGGPLTVTTTDDELDGDTSSIEALLAHRGADGFISLREAITAANNTTGRDSIVLGAGTYAVGLFGATEDLNIRGDFDIRDDLTLTGAGAGLTVLSGSGLSSVLAVVAGSTTASGITVQSGVTLTSGAGVSVHAGASLVMSQSVVRYNAAISGSDGAGIGNAGDLTLIDVEVANNLATGNGGGIFHTGTHLSLERVTLADNRAVNGGGLFAGGAGPSLVNVTVSGNQADDNGGGLYFSQTASLLSSTLADNNATQGGGLFADGTSVSLRNVLLANSGGGSFNTGGGVVSLGNNLSTDAMAELNQASDRTSANAVLGALADNGGFTRTHALLGGSAAINAGHAASAPTLDQRGQARVGVADIGAYEYVGNTAPVLTSNGGGTTAAVAVAEGSFSVTTVTAVDADLPAQTLSYSIAGGADALRFGIDASTGVLRFLAAPDAEQPGDSGEDNIYDVIVQVSDGELTDQQVLAVTVTDVAEPPQANDDTASVNPGDAVTIQVLDNDRPGAGGTLRLIDASAPAHGSVSWAGNVLTYQSQAGYTGTDSLSYRISEDNDGLSHYWALHGNALDSLGSGSGSLAGGAAAVAGQYGQGLRFDGVDDHATLSDVSYANAFTLSLWFRIDDNAGTGYRYLYAHDDPASQNSLNVYFIEQSTNTGSGVTNVLRTSVVDGNDSADLAALDIGATALADGQWHLYTLTVQSSSGSRVYIDGVQQATSGNGGDAINPGGNVQLGTNVTLSSQRYFQGDLDTVQLHQRALDAAEVLALYGGAATEARVNITVGTPANTAPVIGSDGGGDSATLVRVENGTAVTTITATDAQGGGLSYSLAGGADAGLFSIDANTGVLRFLTAPDHETPLDANGDNRYQVSVQVSDGSLVDTQALDIQITNLNEAPAFTHGGGGSSAAVSVAELQTAVVTLTAGDVDSSGLSFSIVGGADAALFTLDAATGALAFRTPPRHRSPADAGLDNVYDVVVQVSDGSLTDQQAVAVSVLNVNEAPVLLGHGLRITEGGTAVPLVVAVDDDSPHGDWTYTASGVVGGRLELNTQPGVAVTRFTQADLDAGRVQFVHDGSEVAPAYLLSVDDGALHSAPLAAEVLFSPRNDAPEVVGLGWGLQDEDGSRLISQAELLAGASDAEGDGLQVRDVVLLAGQGELTALGNGQWRWTPSADWHGEVRLGFVVDDGQAQVANEAGWTVQAINDAPRIVSGGGAAELALVLPENTRDLPAVLASDVDGSDTLRFAIVGGADAARFQLDPVTGALRFVQAPDHEQALDADGDNRYELVLSVSDGTLSATQTLSVQVGNVDEAPTVGRNALVVTNGSITLVLVASDPDSAPEALSYTVETVRNGHFERVDAVGEVLTTFTQADVDAGAVRFVADDSGSLPSYQLRLSDGVTTVLLGAPAVLVQEVGPLLPEPTAPPAAEAPATEPPVDTGPAPEPAPESETDPPQPPPGPTEGTSTPAPDLALGPAPGLEPGAPLRRGLGGASAGAGSTATGGSLTVHGGDVGSMLLSGETSLSATAQLRVAAGLADELQTALRDSQLVQALDHWRQESLAQRDDEQQMLAGGVALTSGLSVGYVLWLARGGVLMASVMSALPAWSTLDPLPVLAQLKRRDDADATPPDDADDLEGLFNTAHRPTAGPVAASAGPPIAAEVAARVAEPATRALQPAPAPAPNAMPTEMPPPPARTLS